ncbi:phage tail tube protein [Clostridium sp. Mt-5]|uniref:Phage tail tube protein n=1 Tax=Clostridium moutaii TaxID=3240932 RepID=A0ABV4BQZ7_9CLOT
MAFTGVFPVYNIIFKIGTKGLASTDTDMVPIADMESFTMKIAGKTDDWVPMTTNGWGRSLMTEKSFTITLKGKRNVGDPGNDYVNNVAWMDGLSCSTRAEIDFPDDSKLNFNCVIDVQNAGGDASTKTAPLEFDLKSDGKPTYTPASNIPVTGVMLDKTTDSIAVGANDTLVATVAPSNATNKNVTWSSSDSATATVDSTGKVTGVAAGTATITVTTEDGNKTATCTVTVA